MVFFCVTGCPRPLSGMPPSPLYLPLPPATLPSRDPFRAQYPSLPCVRIGSRSKHNYIPMEVCQVSSKTNVCKAVYLIAVFCSCPDLLLSLVTRNWPPLGLSGRTFAAPLIVDDLHVKFSGDFRKQGSSLIVLLLLLALLVFRTLSLRYFSFKMSLAWWQRSLKHGSRVPVHDRSSSHHKYGGRVPTKPSLVHAPVGLRSPQARGWPSSTRSRRRT